MKKIYAIACKGCPEYLPKTINRLTSVIPGDQVLLIGDDDNFQLSWDFLINHVRYKDLESRSREDFQLLDEVFMNDGPNPNDFEIFCFKRFFYLESIMDSTGIENIIHLDADILVYSEANLSSEDGDVIIPAKQGTFYSKWSRKGLKEFNKFILNRYFQAPPIHRYCDMDAIEQFSRDSCSKSLSIKISKEEGYSENKRLDLSLTSFLISSHFEKRLGKRIPHHSAEAEDLPFIPDECMKEMFEMKNGKLFHSKHPLSFIHLQGKNKRYFDFFLDTLGG